MEISDNIIPPLPRAGAHLLYVSPELGERMKVNNPACPQNIQVVPCDICVAGVQYYLQAIELPIELPINTSIIKVKDGKKRKRN